MHRLCLCTNAGSAAALSAAACRDWVDQAMELIKSNCRDVNYASPAAPHNRLYISLTYHQLMQGLHAVHNVNCLASCVTGGASCGKLYIVYGIHYIEPFKVGPFLGLVFSSVETVTVYVQILVYRSRESLLCVLQ